MSDLLRTQLQETGRAPLLGCSLARVVRMVTDLGLDPHDMFFKAGSEITVVERSANRGIFNDEGPDDLSDHPDHPDAA